MEVSVYTTYYSLRLLSILFYNVYIVPVYRHPLNYEVYYEKI